MTTIIISIALVCIIAAMIMACLPQTKLTKPEPPKAEPEEPARPPLTDAEREAIRQADEACDWDTHNAIVAGTFTGPLPELIYEGHWSDLYPDIYQTSIAGINFRRGIKDLAGTRFNATLVAEPKNKYDPNAIKIVSYDGRHIGYIPADETDDVRDFISGPLPHPCRVYIDEGEEEVYNEDTDRWRTRHYLIGRVNIPRHKPTV